MTWQNLLTYIKWVTGQWLSSDFYSKGESILWINISLSSVFIKMNRGNNSNDWYYSLSKEVIDLSSLNYDREYQNWILWGVYTLPSNKIMRLNSCTSDSGVTVIACPDPITMGSELNGTFWFRRLSDTQIEILHKSWASTTGKIYISYIRQPREVTESTLNEELDCPNEVLGILYFQMLFFTTPFFLSWWATLASEHYNHAIVYANEVIAIWETFMNWHMHS